MKREPLRLYVSGQMTGLPEFGFPAFRQAAALLRHRGFYVVDPSELGEDPTWHWTDYIKRDLHHVLECDGIATLDNWRDSPGARTEVAVGGMVGIESMSVREWIVRGPLVEAEHHLAGAGILVLPDEMAHEGDDSRDAFMESLVASMQRPYLVPRIMTQSEYEGGVTDVEP